MFTSRIITSFPHRKFPHFLYSFGSLFSLSSSSFSSFPLGFSASGVHCGIKKNENLDLSLIVSDRPCTAAGVFTKNTFRAAPVLACEKMLKSHSDDISGIVINSGCANACTGDKGYTDAMSTIAECKKVGVKNSLVMSTGVIGPFLPLEKIFSGIHHAYSNLSSEESGWMDAAKGIMTTDTFPKLRSMNVPVSCPITGENSSFVIAGISKGAGMIHPNMATMLSVIVTDCKINIECLQSALKHAVDRSFNAISVDGDTSTNDSLVVLANGASSLDHTITDVNSHAYKEFEIALTEIAGMLARDLVRDGEGATKFVTIEVEGAPDYSTGHTIASTIATSALVKTAIYGQDANWGRILCAVGYSGIEIDPDRVSLWFMDTEEETSPGSNTGGLQLVKEGRPYNTDEERATALLQRNDIWIRVELGLGDETARVWTCDFSHEYVSINADYRT